MTDDDDDDDGYCFALYLLCPKIFGKSRAHHHLDFMATHHDQLLPFALYNALDTTGGFVSKYE